MKREFAGYLLIVGPDFQENADQQRDGHNRDPGTFQKLADGDDQQDGRRRQRAQAVQKGLRSPSFCPFPVPSEQPSRPGRG